MFTTSQHPFCDKHIKTNIYSPNKFFVKKQLSPSRVYPNCRYLASPRGTKKKASWYKIGASPWISPSLRRIVCLTERRGAAAAAITTAAAAGTAAAPPDPKAAAAAAVAVAVIYLYRREHRPSCLKGRRYRIRLLGVGEVVQREQQQEEEGEEEEDRQWICP